MTSRPDCPAYPPSGDWNAPVSILSHGLRGCASLVGVYVLLPLAFIVPVVWLAWVLLGPIVVKVIGG